jgi:hypothetical protein
MPEREPIPVAGLTGEISDAEPEVVRKSRPPLPYADEALGEMPGEIADCNAASLLVEPTRKRRRRLRGAGASSTNAAERAPEGALFVAAGPAMAEHPIEPLSEKPSTPRRGWWQRLIQP